MNTDATQQYMAQIDSQISDMIIGALRNTLSQQFSRAEAAEKQVAELTAKLNALTTLPVTTLPEPPK